MIPVYDNIDKTKIIRYCLSKEEQEEVKQYCERMKVIFNAEAVGFYPDKMTVGKSDYILKIFNCTATFN